MAVPIPRTRLPRTRPPRTRHTRGWLTTLLLMVALIGPPTAAGANLESTTIDFEQLPDGTPLTHGQVITTHFFDSDGVSFTGGVLAVHCRDANALCQRAADGANAVQPPRADEFANLPFDIFLSRPREQVTFQLAGFRGSHTTTSFTAIAYDAAGEEVTQVAGSLDQTWREVRVTAPSGQLDVIERVVVSADDGTPNYMLMDTLTTVGDDGTPAPTYPALRVDLQRPEPGAEVEGDSVNVRTRVVADGDNTIQQIRVLVARLDDDGNPVHVNQHFVCGDTPCADHPWATYCSTRGCKDILAFRSVPLTAPGAYRITVDACGLDGACTSESVQIRRIPPGDLRWIGLEVNQGVQGLPDVVDPHRSTQTYLSDVPIIPGKDTLLRLTYGLAAPGPHEIPDTLEVRAFDDDPDTPVEVHVLNRRGSTQSAPAVDASGSDWGDAINAARPNLALTANYLLPGELIDASDVLVIDGRFRVHVGEEAFVGLNVIRVQDSTPFVTASVEDMTARVLPYMRSAMPVSDVVVLSEHTAFWGGEIVGQTHCDVARAMGWWSFGETSARQFPEGNWWNPDFAYTDKTTGWGCYFTHGFYGRNGGNVMTSMDGDTAVHEVGHSIGATHATDLHGEIGDNEPWPYDHGAMSPDGHTVFGVHFGGPAGVEVVDPCPFSQLQDRAGSDPVCNVTSDSNIRHELMSYAESRYQQIGGEPTRGGAWLSDINYRRFYGQITDGQFSPGNGTLTSSRSRSSATTQSMSSGQEALRVTGTLQDGGVEFGPLHTKPTNTPSPFDEPAPDEEDVALVVRLLDADGDVVDERPAIIGTSDGTEQHFAVIFPAQHVVAVQAIIDGHVVGERSLSGAAPRLSSTAVGALTAEGTAPLTFEVADTDVQDTFVWTSADGGATWQPGAYLPPGAPLAADLSFLEPTEGEVDPRVRIVTSDGFSTATAVAIPGHEGPDCGAAVPTHDVIRSNMGRGGFVTVGVTGLPQDVTVDITGITSDEKADGRSVDARLGEAGEAQLKAKRDGHGDGRVYHLAFTAEDDAGASCAGSVQVEVQRSKHTAAVDGGPLHDLL